uniref:CCHC-type domain-containing protein n=1 Tax=Tanacetum cinerariifolium TaxID=118510 RepID=A0A699GJG7_TANCI|nr:hypothetical protein [Tanacetum cinerariifolium]
MDQQNPTLAKIPILDTEIFEKWQFRIQQYLQHEHYALWEVIKFGDSYEVPASTTSTTTTDTSSDVTGKKKGRTVTLTAEDMQKRKNDVKARTTLIGNEATKKTKKNLLKQQYGNFKAEGSETLEQTFNRLQVIVGQLQFMDVEIEQDDLNQKFLTKVQKKSKPNSQNMAFISSTKHSRGNEDVNTASVSTASTNVPTASANIGMASISQDTACAYIASQSNGKKIRIQGTDMAGFDKSEVKCFNCHKMGHFARECRALKSQDRGRRDNYKQGSKVEEQAPKAPMAIDRVGWDWSYMANDEENHALVADKKSPIEFALMANTSAKSKVFDNSLCSKDCKKNTDNLNNKNKEGLGYNIVPPPPAQIYSSPKKDLSWTGLFEFKDDTVTNYSRHAPTIESSPDDAQNRNSSVTEEASPSTILPKSFIKFVKANDSLTKSKIDKAEKAKKYPVKYAEQYRKPTQKPNVRGNQRNWNNLKSHQFGPNFKMKKNACFNCGDFNHLAYDCKKRGSSQNKFDDKGYWDSGCSRHMTSNISYLSDFEPFDEGYVSFGQGGYKITRKRTIKTGKLEFENVYFMKDLKYNLFSVSQICDNKNKVLFTDSECIVLGRNFKLSDDDNVLLRTPRQHNMYLIDLNNIFPHEDLTCLVAKASADECMLWHRRLEAARTMLVDAKLLVTFWAEAVNTACYVQNRVLVNKSQNKTPYELFNGRTPAIGFLKSFSCHVMILNTLDNLGKFKEKGDEEVKKNVSSLRYIALPNWVHDALLESSLSKPQDDCSTDAPESNRNSNPTATLTNPPADQLETLTVETPIPTVEAIQVELLQFKIQNVWTLVDCPKGVRPIGTKWVLKNKKDKRGIVIRNKARLVAQGHIQEEGINYDEVFAPVARIEAIRLFLAYASFMSFTVYQMDVKSAFLYGTIDEEVYMMQPLGFQDPEFPVKVYKVEKAMYGLHQAPRAWYVLLKEDGIFLSQDKYVGDILKKFRYSDVRSSNTPMDKENPWGKDGTGKDVDLHLYRSMIGSLMYLTASRPDIMFAICACARHQVTPKECHLHAVKRIFRYLKGHPKLGLSYPKESPFDLVAYSDNDYGGAIQDCKSTTRVCQFLGRRIETTEEGTKILATIDGILRTVTESPLRRNIKLQDEEGISSLPDMELFENLTLMGYNISPNQKFTFQKDEPTSPLRDVNKGEAFPTKSSLGANQDRANIAKTSTLPYDSAPRVTSPAAAEGTQELEINKLKARVKLLEDREGVDAERFEDDAPIKGRNLDEGEAAAERVSDDTEEMETILTSIDTTTVLASEVADVPTSSGSIPTASSPVAEVPTGSDVVPTASQVFATATVVQEQIDAQVARELEEQMAREDQRMFEQVARDAKVARIYAEEELQMMINILDRSNETVLKYLQEYEQFAADLSIRERAELINNLIKYQENYAQILKFQTQQRKPWSKKQNRDYYMAVIKSNVGWKVKDFRGMTFDEIEAKFTTVSKKLEDFIPMGSKEESERLKTKGLSLEQESVKKLKTSEEVVEEAKSPDEVPEEKVKEMMQLVPIEEVYVEDLQIKHPIID